MGRLRDLLPARRSKFFGAQRTTQTLLLRVTAWPRSVRAYPTVANRVNFAAMIRGRTVRPDLNCRNR